MGILKKIQKQMMKMMISRETKIKQNYKMMMIHRTYKKNLTTTY